MDTHRRRGALQPCVAQMFDDSARDSLYTPVCAWRYNVNAITCVIHKLNNSRKLLLQFVLLWRKLVGVEPTCDTKCRTLVLKTRPSTGQE
jgi:hypothetical protein